jgi:hypothetical protein
VGHINSVYDCFFTANGEQALRQKRRQTTVTTQCKEPNQSTEVHSERRLLIDFCLLIAERFKRKEEKNIHMHAGGKKATLA